MDIVKRKMAVAKKKAAENMKAADKMKSSPAVRLPRFSFVGHGRTWCICRHTSIYTCLHIVHFNEWHVVCCRGDCIQSSYEADSVWVPVGVGGRLRHKAGSALISPGKADLVVTTRNLAKHPQHRTICPDDLPLTHTRGRNTVTSSN
jgi:hypothetical protein